MITTPLTDEQIAALGTVPIFETVAPDVLRWIVRRVEFEHYISDAPGLDAVGITRLNPPPAAPAWEPLTPERLEKLQQEPLHVQYWLACKRYEPEPVIGTLERVGDRIYFSVDDDGYRPEEITHIMPFTTPEMPK